MSLKRPATVRILLLLLTWGLLLGYAWSIRDEFVYLLEMPGQTLITLLMLSALQLLLQTTLLPTLATPLGTRLHWRDWLPIGILTSTGNMFLPVQGATLIRSVYLKRHHQLAYSESLVIVGFQAVAKAITYTLVILIGLSWLERHNNLVSGLFAVLALVLLLLAARQKPGPGGLTTRIRSHPRLARIFDAWFELRTRPLLLVAASTISLCILISNAIVFFLIFQALQNPLHLDLLITFTAAKFFALLIPVAPGNVGISELTTGLLTQFQQLNFDAGVAAALSARLLMMLTAFFLSILSALSLSLFPTRPDQK